ncbi:MAG: hypothetical protein ABI970_01500 [Chloroflexota bacterium]
MDYRELENRMEHNRALIKERAYGRLVKEAKQAAKANRPQRPSWFAVLRSMLLSLRRRKVEPQPKVQLKPQQQLKQH